MTVDFTSLTQWIAAISSLSALIIGLVTALWAYTKFIVERGLLPPVQFDIECNSVGGQLGVTLLEIILNIRNCGSSTLIITNIREDIRYLRDDEVPHLIHLDGTETTAEEKRRRSTLFGRINFTGSLRRDLELLNPTQSDEKDSLESPRAPDQKKKAIIPPKQRAQGKKATRGFSLIPRDTFVQPGIDQQYAFQTAVSASTAYILVWASFEYAQSPRAVQRVMIWLSRRLGLIQFTLQHVTEPHTTERVFKL
jgi:hypothetical protein